MKFNRIFALMLALLMSLCLVLTGCTDDTQTSADPVSENGSALATDAATEEATQADDATQAAVTLTVDVVDADGNTETFTVETDADNLADALLGAELVEGEKGAYGLYIKTVNGIRADYDLDGAYWALYSNGEMLMSGASDTVIADGEHYELIYTAG